jgi:hypothetical protein
MGFADSNPSQTISGIINFGLVGLLHITRHKPLMRCGVVWSDGLGSLTPIYAQD